MQQKVIPASRNKGSWLVNDNGVFFSECSAADGSTGSISPTDSFHCGWTQIATEPVTVLAVLVEDGFYSIEVTFPSLNGRSIIAPRSHFLDSKKIRNIGLPIVPSSQTRNAASLMSSFINDVEEDAPDICSKETLIYRRLHHLLHSQLLPSSKDSCVGSVNTDWLDVGNLLRTEFPYARGILAASFASPLIPLLDHRNIYYHVCAPSLTAKTAILRFAMSIWSNPKQSILFYNATDAGFRDHAEMMSPLPLAIDQLEYLQKSARLSSVIYELSEHYFRDDEKPRPLYRKKCEWHNCIISTGKDSIRSIAPNLKHYPSLLDVKAQPMDSKAVKEFGDYIWSLAGSNYGFAGQLYIKFLEEKMGSKESKEGIRADYLRMLDYLKLLPVSTAVRYEWIENVAVLALGDYYSSQAVFGVEDEKTAWSEAVNLGKLIMSAMSA